MNSFYRYRNIGLLFFLMFSSVVFGFSKDTIVESNRTLIFISKNTETNLLDKVTTKTIVHKKCVEKNLTNKLKKSKKDFVVKKADKPQKKQVYKSKEAIFSSKIKLYSDYDFSENCRKIVLKENFYKYQKIAFRSNSIFSMNLSDIASNLLTLLDTFIYNRRNVIDNIYTRPPPFVVHS